MENGYRKSLNIRFHLDPRTKLLLLILFSVENIAKNLFAFKNNGVFPAEEGGQVK